MEFLAAHFHLIFRFKKMPSKKSYKHRAKPPEERAISSRTRRGGKKKELDEDKEEEEEDVQKETPKKPESAGLLQTGIKYSHHPFESVFLSKSDMVILAFSILFPVRFMYG